MTTDPADSDSILSSLGHCDLCVSAGAGAGKTSLLIKAYFQALKLVGATEPHPYDHVVAITFTNEAAAEIRKRVLEELFKTGNTSAPDRILQANTIGTIHSFCHGLLGEYGHLAGVDPRFAILDDADLADLQRRVADGAATTLLDTGKPGPARLFGQYSFEGGAFVPGLVAFVHQVYTRARWHLFDVERARKEVIASWLRLAAECYIDDPTERRKKIAAGFGVDENVAEFVGQFLGDHHQVIVAFADFARLYWQKLDDAKSQMGQLSQDDTLYYAARLLDNRNVRELLRRRYLFLLIDEYQDTDPLQHRVIEALRSPGRTFRVGDLKQSIYRFRSARPRIFLGLSKEAAVTGSLRSLQTNRRAVPALRDFWNEIFARIFEEGDISYEPLTGETDFYQKPHHPAPPVQVFRLPGGEKAPARRRREAQWITRQILEWVGNRDVYDRLQHTWRKAEFRDVALLFRVRTHIEDYLDALTNHSIPYVFLGMKNLYARPEIQTVVTALHWLAHPTSAFHVAAVLRSPLFSVRDETLVRLAGERFRVDEEISALLDTEAPGEAAILRRFIEVQTRLLALRDGPAWRLIEELLALTGFSDTVLAHPEGLQKYGNLRRLVALTREYDAEPGGSLANLVTRLERAIDEESEESEALVADIDSDAVRVMTVHGAKGLEFPIVFVPDVFRQSRPIARQLLVDAHEEHALAFYLAPPVADSLAESKKRMLRGVVQKLGDRVFVRELGETVAEERRLLYVAFTRAREQLVFSLPEVEDHRPFPPDLPAWSEWLEDVLGPALLEGTREAKVPGGSAAFTIVRDGDLNPPSPQSLLEEKLTDYPARPVAMLARPVMNRVIPSLSAGAIAEYRFCPLRYQLARELGVTTGPSLRSLETNAADAAERGKLAHLALQHCDLRTGMVPTVILERAGDEREWIEEMVRNFATSSVGREASELPPEKILREASFRFEVAGAGATVALGVIDMAYEAKSGWTVVEFKTGEPRRETREMHCDQARVYALGLQAERGFTVSDAVIAYVGHPEMRWARFVPSPADLSTEDISAIARACSAGIYPARPSRDRCTACPFGARSGLCPERYRPPRPARDPAS